MQTITLQLNVYQLECLQMACMRQVGTLNEILSATSALLQAAQAPRLPVPTLPDSPPVAAPDAPAPPADAPAQPAA